MRIHRRGGGGVAGRHRRGAGPAHGRVIVTGCLGARAALIEEAYPQVLPVTGPHAYGEVMTAVHPHLPRPEHQPDAPVHQPATGHKLTPAHHAYVKISEGCNHSCSFCIIPSLRGALVSRPLGAVMADAERLVDSRVRELLIISQDTSAYGLDLKCRTDSWQGHPLRTDIATPAAR